LRWLIRGLSKGGSEWMICFGWLLVMGWEMKSLPQRLKPHCKEGIFGTPEGVPLSKTDRALRNGAPGMDGALHRVIVG
jgi:hypothetical protein